MCKKNVRKKIYENTLMQFHYSCHHDINLMSSVISHRWHKQQTFILIIYK